MEIETLGQALHLAQKLEAAGIECYSQADEMAKSEALKNLFKEFCAANQRRRQIIEAIYNENVNSDMDTGILAPIEPMNGANYLHNSVPGDVQDAETISAMVCLEECSEAFYLDLLQRLPSSPRSIPRRVKKLAEENALRGSQLKENLGS